MPNLAISSIGTTGFQWRIEDLGYDWTSVQYKYVYIKVGTLTSDANYPPTPPNDGVNYSTTKTYTGLSEGESYVVTGYIVANDANSTVYSTSPVTVQLNSVNPSSGSPSGVSASTPTFNGTNYSTTISWNKGTSTNFNYYAIYANDVYKNSVSRASGLTSLAITLDSSGTSYTIKVVACNDIGCSSSSGSTTVSTPGGNDYTTAPTVTAHTPTYDSSTNNFLCNVSWTSIRGASYYQINANGVFKSNVYDPTTSTTITLDSPNTTYTISVKAVFSDFSTGATGTATVQTLAAGSPPTGAPTVSATNPVYNSSSNNYSTTVSWTSVSTATKYKVYTTYYTNNPDVYKGEFTGSSGSITLDYANVTYTIKVVASNSAGDASTSGTVQVTTGMQGTQPPRTDYNPPFSYFYNITDVTSNGVTAYAIGADNEANTRVGMGGIIYGYHKALGPDDYYSPSTPVVEVARVPFFENDNASNAARAVYTYTQFEPSSYYWLAIKAYDAYNNTQATWTFSNSQVITLEAKPSVWAWANPKVAGQSFNITANEWNNFTNKINEVRAYYDKKYSTSIGQYPFTTAPYGDGKFYAFMYNQTVTAINQMNPPTSLPSTTSSTKSTGDVVKAKYFDDLRVSLNSLLQ